MPTKSPAVSQQSPERAGRRELPAERGVDLEALGQLMSALQQGGAAPGDVHALYQRLGPQGQQLVLADANLSRELEALGVGPTAEGGLLAGAASTLLQAGDAAVRRGEGMAGQRFTADGGLTGIGTWMSDFADATRQSLWARDPALDQEEQVPEGVDTAPEHTPRADMLTEMLKLGYGEDYGTEAWEARRDAGAIEEQTRYGAYTVNGVPLGDMQGTGEGGVFRTPDEQGEKIKWNGSRWVGASGTTYGRDVERVFEPDGEFHCVGAVSTVFELAGLYDTGDYAPEEFLELDHQSAGERITIGGADISMKSVVYLNLFSAPAKTLEAVDAAIASLGDGALVEAAIEAAAEAGLQEGSAEYEAFLLDYRYARFEHDERLEGATAALDIADFGERVLPSRIKPGDVSQTWDRYRRSAGGHNTLVLIVEAYGLAKRSGERVTADGTWQEGSFLLDQSTDPALVGPHVARSVRRLGAHSRAAREVDPISGQHREGSGIHVADTEKLGEAKDLEFYARPSNSPWAGWEPAFSTAEEALAAEAPEADASSAQAWGAWVGGSLRSARERVLGGEDER
ncbi:MAG: hypothetical protein JXX28_12805 [Deltaproteobacteria bacterium]|nr:hypothetical protein [Deltaproteobacteria bacterium]